VGLIPARPRFIACEAEADAADVVLYGLPFEGRVNQRKGADRGPAEIRRASDLIETYSPALGADLADLRLADAGDVAVPAGDARAALAAIRAELGRRLDPRQRWVFLGGDHTVAAPVVEAALAHHPELRVVQFDAHPDLRREYLDERWNYASAMSRVLDHLAPARLYQVGLRTGDREEWEPPRGTRVFPAWAGPAREAAARIAPELAGHPVHVTIDIDVLDPAVAPGTGAPEPGGTDVPDLVAALHRLGGAGARIVGVDLVEVSPAWDPSGRTGVTAAVVLREAILGWWGRARGPAPAGAGGGAR
jgi:agmatinase